ncbi:MAG: caspase family protein [Chryseolinea sp.]
MSVGYSIHIGLDNADPKKYPGLPKLKACVKDAKDWKSFAVKNGFKATSFHDKQASSKAIEKVLNDHAKKLKPGDILLLTYSGHGGEIPNDSGADGDDELIDQTWCLYDRQFLDDEIFDCLKKFKSGVRITVISDSCHSGTVTRVQGELNLSDLLTQGMTTETNRSGARSRKMSKKVAAASYAASEELYKGVQQKIKAQRDKDRTSATNGKINASVKLLAACQDDEETLDGKANGLFTGTLLSLLSDAEYTASSAEKIIAGVTGKYHFPTPNFFQYGGIIASYDFGSPFSIKIPNASTVTGYRKPDPMPSRSPKVVKSFEGPWDTLDSKCPAVLLIESPQKLENVVEGKDTTILKNEEKNGKQRITVELHNVPVERAWSAAHALATQLSKETPGVRVEPLISKSPGQREAVSRAADPHNTGYIKDWPPSLEQGQDGTRIGWHLDDKHSQLAKAFNTVISSNPDASVVIGHFDTGYIPGHPALPKNLQVDKARSFVSGDDPNKAIDKTDSGQDGHGLGTLTLLAGNKVTKAQTFDEYEGYVGGAPFAKVIPIRISESVVILNSQTFCDAVEYAIANNCEVVSMSMAGKPSVRMAEAVNAAYEAGIVLVTAASNCWYKGTGAILPKCVMFPAAFERVIAATGAMFNHMPYDVEYVQQARMNIGTQYMQGCWGPPSRMRKALAGYTPNIPWAAVSPEFLRSGGGTSSATPQVAAAAALWIAHHRKTLEEKGYYNKGNGWKKVEAVRNALFTSAAKGEVFPYWEKYFGNGILRANDALAVGVPDITKLKKSKEAQSSIFGLTETVGAFFKNRRLFRGKSVRPEPDALAMELLDLIQTDPAFYKDFSCLDMDDPAAVKKLINRDDFATRIQQSPYASTYLKMAVSK